MLSLALPLAAWAAPPGRSEGDSPAAIRARIDAALQKSPSSQPTKRDRTRVATPNKVVVAAQNVPAIAAPTWTLDDAARARTHIYYPLPPIAVAPPAQGPQIQPVPPSTSRTPSNDVSPAPAPDGQPPVVVLAPTPIAPPIPPVAVLPGRVFNAIDMDQRAGRLLAKADDTIQNGLRELRAADYESAAMSFRLAAELDQADPVARIHFAHAALGTGEYEAAGVALRRALELQDKLILMRFEHERYFSSEPEFNRLVDRFARLMQSEGGVGDEHFLLGYIHHQRGHRPEAAAAFQSARDAGIKDDSLSRLLDLTATKRR